MCFSYIRKFNAYGFMYFSTYIREVNESHCSYGQDLLNELNKYLHFIQGYLHFIWVLPIYSCQDGMNSRLSGSSLVCRLSKASK